MPGNLAADYNLTSDGRYVLRAYRKNYDEGVLQGNITETGANFIISMDYNRFRQLFMKRRRDRNKTKKTNPGNQAVDSTAGQVTRNSVK